MSTPMLGQRMAQVAFDRVGGGDRGDEYASFARQFPTLVHSCGLAQAVAFARAKKQERYLADLAAALAEAGHPDAGTTEALATASREAPLAAYLRLSRDALRAAVWIKRYVEAPARTVAEGAARA